MNTLSIRDYCKTLLYALGICGFLLGMSVLALYSIVSKTLRGRL